MNNLLSELIFVTILGVASSSFLFITHCILFNYLFVGKTQFLASVKKVIKGHTFNCNNYAYFNYLFVPWFVFCVLEGQSQFGGLLIIGAILIFIALIDSQFKEIPDYLSLSFFVLVLALVVLNQTESIPFFNHSLGEALLTGVVTFLIFTAISYLYFSIRKTLGMAYGDIKLISFISAYVGALNIAYVIVLSFALFLFIQFLEYNKHIRKEIAFAPYICVASLIVIALNFSKTLPLNF